VPVEPGDLSTAFERTLRERVPEGCFPSWLGTGALPIVRVEGLSAPAAPEPAREPASRKAGKGSAKSIPLR
jgi:hypothetical protein